MSTVTNPQQGQAVPPDADPFRYGWRYKFTQQPDGTRKVEEVPLTLEDVLHPQMGDVILEGSAHGKNCRYLADAFAARLADDPTALVLSDQGIYWDAEGLRHHSPDIAVLVGVREQRDNWSSFDVAEQGVRPFLIIELTSPNTRNVDVIDKLREYHQAGVPQYVVVDQQREDGPLEVIGYRHAAEGYQALPRDGRGRVLLDRLGLWLGVAGHRVILYDAATDAEVGDYEGISRRLDAELQARQAAETQARTETEARRAAEAQARAAVEARQAAEAQARADAEARRAAEERLLELEAELRRLRGDQN